ncbi:GNAT family N-acetyltransferase [Caldimonas thermodepolymerans]|uniref:GNAT family N-acetyltransferase n=1 Tax=Caldimonas thermodepolymerans TaxID=215580 RepID=A0A2S5T958_9BURK|nr:GNAT family N-acetyltransferase [Caldimonas thermodepolymerans]PPE71486.1 GNAT family N-acetyltransferase [Caldimonas thermodepolymerans]QPC30514.1 GNAT family N-acetyltransferase [Caldimonas thermodepolymerans]RDI02900.1 acetyltransferase (GNAT) family protein [Caldimonas thermodepolymerans]
MGYSIRRVDGAAHEDTLRSLHVLTFPCDEHEDYTEGWWWLAYLNGEPVAFAGMRWAVSEAEAVYLSRCGVLIGHRGNGLQRRFLAARLRYAKSLWARAAITTTYNNPASANNLIRAGFRLYTPDTPWSVLGTNYWRRDLT